MEAQSTKADTDLSTSWNRTTRSTGIILGTLSGLGTDPTCRARCAPSLLPLLPLLAVLVLVELSAALLYDANDDVNPPHEHIRWRKQTSSKRRAGRRTTTMTAPACSMSRESPSDTPRRRTVSLRVDVRAETVAVSVEKGVRK